MHTNVKNLLINYEYKRRKMNFKKFLLSQDTGQVLDQVP